MRTLFDWIQAGFVALGIVVFVCLVAAILELGIAQLIYGLGQ